MADFIPILSDLLLFAAALGAGAYCMILSRRLTRLSSIDKGLGGAIAVLSAQVDDMTKALADARTNSDATVERLSGLMTEAETLANDLEVMLAACHDLVPDGSSAPAEPAPPATEPDETAAPENAEEDTQEDEAPAVEFRRSRTSADEVPVFRRGRAQPEAAE